MTNRLTLEDHRQPVVRATAALAATPATEPAESVAYLTRRWEEAESESLPSRAPTVRTNPVERVRFSYD